MTDPPHETVALAEALGGGVSPEVLFGVGGGAGFGWFVYGDHATLLSRITTRENARESFLLDVCTRLGIPARLVAASSGSALARRVAERQAAGEAVLVLVAGPGTAYGAELVGELTDDQVRRAAAAPGAARNRILAVRPGRPAPQALRAAMEAGLAAHAAQMRDGFGPPATRRSFGLAGFDRFRRSLPGLDAAARTRLRDQVLNRGGGPAMRLAHAEFLESAGRPVAAGHMRAAASAWAVLADDPRAEVAAAVEAAERAALEGES